MPPINTYQSIDMELSRFSLLPHLLHTQAQPRSTHRTPNMSQITPDAGNSQQLVFAPLDHLYTHTRSRSTHGMPNISQNTPDSGNSQHHTRNQYQIPTQTPAPTSDQDQSEAENEHLNAQAAVLLNSFLAKTRRPLASELGDDMSCTICSEPFLRGSNPEVPVRLDCGHIFGMNCILKWLSPVSRNGNNSCPNCRHPVFDDWDKMDFPAPRPVRRPMRRPIRPIRRGAISAASPQVNTRTRVPIATVSAADASRGQRDGPPPLPWHALAARTQEAFNRWQAVDEPQAALRLDTRNLETSTPDDTRASRLRVLHSQVRHEEATLELGEYDAARMRSRLARSREQLRRLEGSSPIRPNVQRAIPTPAPVRAARPYEDEENIDGVAAMFNAAETEHDQRRQQAVTNERKRYMWMQFCEGVVRTIEQSTERIALADHDLALKIINMKDLDEFMAERAAESPTWHRILQTFPRLHTEMVTRFDDFRPLPSVNIDRRIELELLLVSTLFDRETLHRSRWYTRLSEHLALGAATSIHEATVARLKEQVARLTERVANLSGPSRETTASSTTASSGGQSTREEAREMRRMEDYLLGRGPITARMETAASVDAALRAGAAESSAMTMVTRL